MPTYQYEAMNSAGKQHKGTIEAGSSEEAIQPRTCSAKSRSAVDGCRLADSGNLLELWFHVRAHTAFLEQDAAAELPSGARIPILHRNSWRG